MDKKRVEIFTLHFILYTLNVIQVDQEIEEMDKKRVEIEAKAKATREALASAKEANLVAKREMEREVAKMLEAKLERERDERVTQLQQV